MNERERHLLQQIGRTGRAMYAAFEAQVGHPLPRWRILQALRAHGAASQKQLAQQLLMDPGALTRQMKTLEAEGLVTRQSAVEDNRLTTVALTATGSALIDAAEPQRRAFARKALKGLPATQIDAALDLLQTLEGRFRLMQGL